MKTFTKFLALLFAFAIIGSTTMNAQNWYDDATLVNGDAGQPLLEIWIYGANTPAGTLEAGDVIGVFSGDELVGKLKLTVTPSTTTVWSCHLIAYSKNTSGTDLYAPGEAFTLKCWDGSDESVAYTWGDGNQIDFHNSWYAPTSDSCEVAKTCGAYFPALGDYSYSYVDATFVAGSIPLNVDYTINLYDGGVIKDTIDNAIITAGAYTGTGTNGVYNIDLFSGDDPSSVDFSYSIFIDVFGYKDEYLYVDVNSDGSPYTEDVYLGVEADLSGTVEKYDIDAGYIIAENVLVTCTIYDTIFSDYTDANGDYLIENIPDGTWQFMYIYDGYITDTVDVVINTSGVNVTDEDVQLDLKVGTLSGEIFDATTNNLITSSLKVEIWANDLSGSALATISTSDGTYEISYFGGTYAIKVYATGSDYLEFILYDKVLYPDYTEIQNFNLLPDPDPGSVYDPITGDPNNLWSIHIEMAKFGDNFLLPWDELVIFNLDNQVGVIGDEPGLRVGTLRFQNTSVWQNSGINVLKAYAVISGGTNPSFNAGDEMEFWAYDISQGAYYEVPIDWWFNAGVGNHSAKVFPDFTTNPNPISYLNIYWEGVSGSLSGEVTSGGSGIDDVLIEVLNVYTQEVIASANTAGGGLYSITTLDEGTYDARITKEGYDGLLKENIVIVENQVTVFDTSLVAKVPVSLTYYLPQAGYFFIGRALEQDPVEDDMLTLLDNSVGTYSPFSTNYFNSWVENDTALRLYNDNPVPTTSNWTNDPYTWDLLEGYQVYRTIHYKFTMDGYLVEPEYNPIEFTAAGIYYIPYFPYDYLNQDDAITAFAGIFDELDWVMDGEGNRLHHDGGGWIDNIGEMSLMEGYKIKINEACTLTYPGAKKSTLRRSVVMEPEYFVYTGGNAADWTYTIYIETDEFEIGDEIAAFSNGVMVGSMVIDSEDPWENDLNMFYEAVEGGYVVNSPIELVAYDASEHVDYSVEYEMIDVNNGCYPGRTFPAGLFQYSYAHIYRGTVSVDKNQVDNNVKLYPNPTSGTLNIESSSNINELEVYNIYGTLITIINVNAKQHQIDVSGYVTGAYLVQLHTDTGVITKRVIIK